MNFCHSVKTNIYLIKRRFELLTRKNNENNISNQKNSQQKIKHVQLTSNTHFCSHPPLLAKTKIKTKGTSQKQNKKNQFVPAQHMSMFVLHRVT